MLVKNAIGAGLVLLGRIPSRILRKKNSTNTFHRKSFGKLFSFKIRYSLLAGSKFSTRNEEVLYLFYNVEFAVRVLVQCNQNCIIYLLHIIIIVIVNSLNPTFI